MMIKLDAQITAKQPIHTGADESTGTERKLRREKVLLPEPLKFESRFTSEEKRREAILIILMNVWRNIDFESMPQGRLMVIYDEFASKLLASTGVPTKEQFLNKISEKWGIRALTDERIVDIIDKFGDEELLETIRQEYQYLTLMIRKRSKEKQGDNGQQNIFDDQEKQEGERPVFEKHFDTVPYIAGNSIRGLMRRLVMKDFCDQVGITKLDKDTYHQLFTGGKITDNTGFEDIDKREKLIRMCPMIGLFGSAIGNMTIEGDLKVGGARLHCKENGTGNQSYWELIDTTFGTRLDSSKTEKDMEITNDDGESKNQMKYEYEVFISGSKFTATFALTNDDDLIRSAFYRSLRLLQDFGYIAGQSARDAGHVEFDFGTFPDEPGQLYCQTLQERKDDIRAYFQSI